MNECVWKQFTATYFYPLSISFIKKITLAQSQKTNNPPDTIQVVLTTCETSCQFTNEKFQIQKIVTVNRQIMIERAIKPMSVFI
jgi:hypothetical protein